MRTGEIVWKPAADDSCALRRRRELQIFERTNCVKSRRAIKRGEKKTNHRVSPWSNTTGRNNARVIGRKSDDYTRPYYIVRACNNDSCTEEALLRLVFSTLTINQTRLPPSSFTGPFVGSLRCHCGGTWLITSGRFSSRCLLHARAVYLCKCGNNMQTRRFVIIFAVSTLLPVLYFSFIYLAGDSSHETTPPTTVCATSIEMENARVFSAIERGRKQRFSNEFFFFLHST